ncbi:MAG: hypothetical protein R3B72_09940 [Polyangiaceae bacterium]
MRGLALVSLLVVLGCQDPTPAPTASSSSASALPASSGVAATAAATVSAAPRHPFAGAWSGKGEVAKGEVRVPDGVPYDVWKEEKGDVATGPLEIELTVLDSGAVKGTGKGALGELSLIGVVVDQELSASLQPADPNAEGAMTGTLIAKIDGPAMEGEVRASGRDGTVVRGGKVTLKRAP